MVPNPLTVWKHEHGVEGEDTKAEWALLARITELEEALHVIVDSLPPGDDPYDGTANTIIGPLARTTLRGKEVMP